MKLKHVIRISLFVLAYIGCLWLLNAHGWYAENIASESFRDTQLEDAIYYFPPILIIVVIIAFIGIVYKSIPIFVLWVIGYLIYSFVDLLMLQKNRRRVTVNDMKRFYPEGAPTETIDKDGNKQKIEVKPNRWQVQLQVYDELIWHDVDKLTYEAFQEEHKQCPFEVSIIHKVSFFTGKREIMLLKQSSSL